MASSATTLEESDLALAWLKQFNAIDREVARQCLRQLRLVSESEFDREIQTQLSSILGEHPDQNFALFSVTEPPNRFVLQGDRRIAGSSADRIKHVIENTARVHGARISANPTVESMRAQRIRNVVLVDDFVGSGKRVTDFWSQLMSKSVKSWISRGWTRVWLVTYSAFDEGIRLAVRNIRGLEHDRVRIVLDATAARIGLTEPMRDVFGRYGAAAATDSIGLGFGAGGCTLIFQHGCPNNAPLVLWKSAKRFKALFPNRGIPAELQEYFERPQPLERTELLWNSRQYNLALSLLEDVKHGAPRLAQWEFVTALALCSRHTHWDDTWLAQRMRLPEAKIAGLKSVAYQLHLVNPTNHELTAFGKELLVRLRRPNTVARRPQRSPRALQKLNQVYYPDSCGGRSKH